MKPQLSSGGTHPPKTAKELLSRYARGERDFAGAKLDGETYHLRDVDLEGTDLSGSYVTADFQRANLTRASFAGANVKTSDFRGADLREADFRGAALEATQFDGANLSGAMFDAVS